MLELAADQEAPLPTFGAADDELVAPCELEGGDLGVAKWAKWDLDRLCNHLGFLSGRPALFAAWRSKSGIEVYLEDVEEADREEFVLMWHQVVANAAMSEGFWTSAPVSEPGAVPGMLLADSVGLGKTVEMMGLMAMIIQTRQAELQEKGVRAHVISKSISFSRALSCQGAPRLPSRGGATDRAQPRRAFRERAAEVRCCTPTALPGRSRTATMGRGGASEQAQPLRAFQERAAGARC